MYFLIIVFNDEQKNLLDFNRRFLFFRFSFPDFLILEQKNKAPKEAKEQEANGDTLRRQSTDHHKSKDRHTSSSSDGKDSKKEISFTKSLEMSMESSNGNGHIEPGELALSLYAVITFLSA